MRCVFYGVYGRTGVGVFTTWDQARDARDGMFSGNCRKFYNREEAEKWTIQQFNHLHHRIVLRENLYSRQCVDLNQLIELKLPYGEFGEEN